MVVGNAVMSSPRLVAARTPPRRGLTPPDPGGGGEVGGRGELARHEMDSVMAEDTNDGARINASGSVLPPALARMVAVARHGNLATLPPPQRHLVARVLLCQGGHGNRATEDGLLQQRCIRLAQRLQQQQQRRAKEERVAVFKEPMAPPAPSALRLKSRVPKENASAAFVESKLKQQHQPQAGEESDRQWVPVSRCFLEGAREPKGGNQWRPVKMGRLCLGTPPPSPASPQGNSSEPCLLPLGPSTPYDSREPSSAREDSRIPCATCERAQPACERDQSLGSNRVPGTTCTMCWSNKNNVNINNNNVKAEGRPFCHQHFHLRHKEIARRLRRRRRMHRGLSLLSGPAPPIPTPALAPAPAPAAASECQGGHKFSWLNQLTRIFLQETPEDAQGKEAEAAEGEAAAAASRPSLPHGDGNSACSSSNIDSSSSSNSSKVATLSTPQSSSVVTTLAGSGMGNPFARAASQGTWGSESNDQKPILAPPRLAPPSDSGTTKVSSSGLSVIRPSTLGSGRPGGSSRSGTSLFTPPTLTVTSSSPPQASKSAFKLKPSVLSGSANPFAKCSSDPEDKAATDQEEGSSEEPTPSLSSSQDVSSSTSKQLEDRDGLMEKQSPATQASNTNNSNSESSSSGTSSTNSNSNNSSRSLFVPLARNGEGSDGSISPSITRNSSFIFGQNLQSKVAGDASVTSSSDSAATTNGENPTGNLFSDAASEISRVPDSAATNGRMATGNLFSDAASEISLVGPREDTSWNSRQSLAESSRELTEKENSQKRKFDQVEVITGEENESNVLQMNCKLYAWVSGSWQERGRGILRLNDWNAGQEIHSRLVIRTQGTLTVMLNTKVWSDMSVERASSKSVRFTALDADGQPKIFLAMGSPKDVDLLYNSLEWRVAASRSQTNDEAQADSVKKAKKDEPEAESLTS